jgi:cytochrome c peroxidase
VFRISCDASAAPHPQLGRTFLTQDPGRALITGKCADAGSILMQQFRGLAARAPYFANGSAADLTELVDFYDRRFKIELAAQDKQDLVNFLSIL